MDASLVFLIERTIINSAAIFIAGGLAAYIAGPFLIKIGAAAIMRVSVYAASGAAGGIWAFHAFDLRGIEDFPQAAIVALALTMLVYAWLIFGSIVWLRQVRTKR